MSSRPANKPTGQRQSGQSQRQKQKQGQAQQLQKQPSVPFANGNGKPQTIQQAVKPTQADRREARTERQAIARVAAERRRRRQMTRNISIIAVLFLVAAGIVAALMIREANKPGQLVAQQASRPHVKPGQTHPAYITDPPTSGPHVGQIPDWKVYSEPITKELQVHGLEDGGVIINYQPNLDKAVVDRLAALTTSYTQQIDPDPSNPAVKHPNRVVMSPYPGLSNPIVLTAWRRIDRLDTFDEVRIRHFADEYAGIDRHAESDNGDLIPGLTGQP